MLGRPAVRYLKDDLRSPRPARLARLAALLVTRFARSFGAYVAVLRRQGGRLRRLPVTWRRSRHAGLALRVRRRSKLLRALARFAREHARTAPHRSHTPPQPIALLAPTALRCSSLARCLPTVLAVARNGRRARATLDGHLPGDRRLSESSDSRHHVPEIHCSSVHLQPTDRRETPREGRFGALPSDGTPTTRSHWRGRPRRRGARRGSGPPGRSPHSRGSGRCRSPGRG